jgi:hypothetical protein
VVTRNFKINLKVHNKSLNNLTRKTGNAEDQFKGWISRFEKDDAEESKDS